MDVPTNKPAATTAASVGATPEERAANIRAAYATIRANLEEPPEMTEDRANKRAGVGEARKGMVDDCLNAANERAGMLSGDFDLADFARHAGAFESYDEFADANKSIGATQDSVKQHHGSRAYRYSLRVYELAQSAARHDPSYKPLVERLAGHFKNRGGPGPAAAGGAGGKI